MEEYAFSHVLRNITLNKLKGGWAMILLRGGHQIHCKVHDIEWPYIYAAPAYIEYDPQSVGEAERWLMININDIMTYAPSEGFSNEQSETDEVKQ